MAKLSGTQRAALITGANKGLGFETARQLGKQGFVVLVGSRNETRAAQAVDKLRGEGIDARVLALDVTSGTSIEASLAWVHENVGRLDVLVNNAGIAVHRAPPSELTVELLREAFDTNFFGAFAVLKTYLPLLLASPAGRIVNVSSIVGSLFRLSDHEWEFAERVLSGFAYSASKTALNALTIAFAKELRGTPAKINAVCPGFTATDFNQFKGPRKPEDSVKLIVRFATLDEHGPSGGFFDDAGRIPW